MKRENESYKKYCERRQREKLLVERKLRGTVLWYASGIRRCRPPGGLYRHPDGTRLTKREKKAAKRIRIITCFGGRLTNYLRQMQ